MSFTPEEREIIEMLGRAFELHNNLPIQHPMHRQEFSHAIHQAQRIVMCRPVARDEGWVKDTKDFPS